MTSPGGSAKTHTMNPPYCFYGDSPCADRSTRGYHQRQPRQAREPGPRTPGCTPASGHSGAGPESSIGEPGDSVVECGAVELWRCESRRGRSQSMDGTAVTLKEKLDPLLREAAEVSVALDQADGTIVGVPHYAVIEARVHELGQPLSRQIQARQMGQIAARAADTAKCPECGTRCQLGTPETSGDLHRRLPHRGGAGGSLPRLPPGLFPPPGIVGLRRP